MQHLKFTKSGIQLKITRYLKQEDMTHNQEKNQSIEAQTQS